VKPGFVGASQDMPMKFICQSPSFAFSNFYLTFNHHQSWLVRELCKSYYEKPGFSYDIFFSSVRTCISPPSSSPSVLNWAAFSDILGEIIDQYYLFLLWDSSVVMNLEIVDFNKLTMLLVLLI
jgi:hypothetical protein